VTLEETNCFKMLDRYSRTRHGCFLAEMDLNTAKANYTLRFRPAAISKESPNLNACLYLHIAAEDVRAAGQEQTLPASHNPNARQGTSRATAVVVTKSGHNAQNPVVSDAMLRQQRRSGLPSATPMRQQK
jgi:hypothetical protein